MARLVRHEATGPIKVEPQDKPVFICGCGLSQHLPFCDGAHKLCKKGDGEAAGKVYVYDKTRTKVVRVEDDTE